MLLTSALVVPAMAVRPRRGAKVRASSVCPISTSGLISRRSSPFFPFADRTPSASETSTPDGSCTGYLAILDIALNPSEYGAEHFTTDTSGSSRTIGHETLAGRDDRNPQPAANARKLFGSCIAPEPGSAGTGNFFYGRPSLKISKLDGELLLDVP